MKRIAILVTVWTMAMAVTTMVPPARAASTASAVSAAPAAAVTRLSDFNGDGFTDLVARDTAGRLWLYPGNGTGGFKARHLIGGGWNSMTAIFTPGDVTVDPQLCGVNLTCPPDGKADVIARDSVGNLLIYNGNGAGGLEGPFARLGFYDGEFKGYTITNAADLNATELPDVLASDSAGVLWVYPLRIFRDFSMGEAAGGPTSRGRGSGSAAAGIHTPSGVPATPPATERPTSWLETQPDCYGSTRATARVASRPAPWSAGAGRG